MASSETDRPTATQQTKRDIQRDQKDQRLAEQLRANLRKRKSQQRGRKAQAPSTDR